MPIRGFRPMRALLLSSFLAVTPAKAADLVVSAQDGKFVRVEGRATFPQPAPSDSLAVIDLAQSPPAIKAVIEGVEHTVQGPPEAVAITPDGKLAVVGAPTRYDYAAKKEIFDTFLQPVDLEASPPRLLDKVELGVHTNGLAINPEGTLLLAAALDGTVRVLGIEGKSLKPLQEVKVGQKRLSGISFTHDGKAAIVALRDEGGAVVLAVDGNSIRATDEGITTGYSPYVVDVSSDGKWALIGSTGFGGNIGLTGRKTGGADVVTLVDTSKHPFQAVQHLSVPSTAEGVAISPDGRWIVVQSMAGTQFTPDNPGRSKQGKLVLFEIKDGMASEVNELPGGEASQGVVFSKDSKTVLVQFNVERALAVYRIEGGKLVDTGERLKLAAGPVSIRSMPR